MILLICDHRALLLVILAHLLDKILRLLLDIKRVQALLVEIVLSLLFNMIHLVLEVLLNFLVLSEFEDITLFSLHLVPSGVIIDHIAPESVLFFLLPKKRWNR